MKHESQTIEANNYTESVAQQLEKHPVFQVTTVSKYLALALFVLLPFLGGYVGYQFASNKIVEIEKIVVVEKGTDSPILEESISEPIIGIVDDMGGRNFAFVDQEIGILFNYPREWGEIEVIDEGVSSRISPDKSRYEEFDCVLEYNDPCNFRSYSFEAGGIFLSAETVGHHENPVGRGAFWGDSAGNITPSYLNVCKEDEKCEIVSNVHDHFFALYESDPPPEEMGFMPERYYIYNPESPYYGIVLSAHRLPESYKERFIDVLLESFQLTY